MSDEELRDSINIIAQKIVEIEDVAKKKLDYVKNRLSQEFDEKIKEVEAKLESKQFELAEVNEKLKYLGTKKNELNPIVKSLEKQRKRLRKEMESSVKAKVKAIENEKKIKMKELDKEIRIIEKELKKPE